MSVSLESVVTTVEDDIRPEFESIWTEVTTTSVPDYQILIWGSTVDDRDRDPVDLDLIFEYYTTPLDEDKETSIESWLQNSVQLTNFSYVDPLVRHHHETPRLVSQSRNSRVYCIDTDAWLEFD